MPETQRPLAPHTLSVPAARTLSHPTLTVPQMLAESPRWLLHLLPWLNIQGGVYQVNRRRIVLRQSDRIPTGGSMTKLRRCERIARAFAVANRG